MGERVTFDRDLQASKPEVRLSLSRAGVTGVQKIADSAGKIATEVQGFGTDLQTISSTWSDPIRRLGTIFAVWIAIVWLVLVVAYFKKALDLLLGR